MPRGMNLTCPTCKKTFPREPRRKSYPFCNNRCKMVDLGNWFAGAYVISRPIDPDSDAEALEEFLRRSEQLQAEGLEPN